MRLPFLLPALSLAILSGCGGSPQESVNLKPSYLGDISTQAYDGNTDDLLTAGLGKSGLAGSAPAVADAQQPTATELRQLAIYSNYRAIVDISSGGGYGRLYGPNIDTQGQDTLGEGKIAGREYLAYSDDGTGRQNVSLLLQVPANFNPNGGCIVATASSGSRGVYGAIATAGEWGLKHGCAVAYTDKGTGNGVHDLINDTVTLQNGVRANAATAGKQSQFTVPFSATERAAFNQATPNRVAVKHAHSQQNPEKDWGKSTLQAVEFAFYVLNEQYGKLAQDGKRHLNTLTPKNTLVMAASISNGGGAVLAALEQDTQGLLGGVVASEPNIQLPDDSRLTVARGSNRLTGSGKPLLDYMTLANLLQPCAALAPNVADAPLRSAIVDATAAARCTALRKAGLLSGNSTADLALAAQKVLQDAGYQAESAPLHAAMYATATSSVVTTFANAYGKFSVADHLCGFSFGADASKLATVFGSGNGVPPMAANGITILNNNSVGGAVSDALSISPSSGVRDYNFDGAQCQRDLATGSSAAAQQVRSGMAAVQRSANLRGKPAIIVHGRADTLIPVAFSSRPYYGMNRIVEGTASRLSYIEVSNAQHFDSFLSQPGFDRRYLPLHVYFNQALDMLYANLKSGSALPASQLVRTTPRAVDANGNVTALGSSNLPPIKTSPAAADAIIFSNNLLTIPD